MRRTRWQRLPAELAGRRHQPPAADLSRLWPHARPRRPPGGATTTGLSSCTGRLSRPPFLGLAVMVCIMVCVWMTGCQEDPEEIRLDFQHTAASSAVVEDDSLCLNVAVSAMTSPQETFHAYSELLAYLGDKSGLRTRFKQRKTYAETNELLLAGRLDLAFICSGAYVAVPSDRLQLLAVPVIGGLTSYRSYLVVPVTAQVESIADMRGKSFAYTDPLSLTGCLYPRTLIERLGSSPDDFFSRVIYTHGHDKSIMAVARGMVHGAFVDGLVYDYLVAHRRHDLAGVKVVDRSPPFGIPPVVIPSDLAAPKRAMLQDILLTMHADSLGSRILEELMIDRFVTGSDSLYGSIRELTAELRSETP